MSIWQLLNLVSPPQNPLETAPRKGWQEIEKRLGLQLPSDFKSLIDYYGTGVFNEQVFIFNPFAKLDYLNLFEALDTCRQAEGKTRLMGDLAWSVVHPFELYPATDGLIPWGTLNNFSSTFFWKTTGPADNWETIFYDLKTGEYEVWKMPCTDLLGGLFTKDIESVLFPEVFFDQGDAVTFHP